MKKTILIAEDDVNIAAALSIRLRAAGYEVLALPDGIRSFMAAVARKPNLILMDICIPYGDGLAVARELKGVDLDEIPIIFITASKEKSFERRAQEAGAAGFFRKPFDSEKLLLAIANTLKHTRGAMPRRGTTMTA